MACRVAPLRKAEEERVRAERVAAVAGFRALVSEKGDINSTSRWSKVKDVSWNRVAMWPIFLGFNLFVVSNNLMVFGFNGLLAALS